jgi:DMSO reductase family type II enzyme chaperone|tara:strand:- start:3271 stop:3888 length:618 start_codon:yes stop_codon:yes gene_type:complete
MAYAVMSDLLASPHDVESVVYNNSDTIDLSDLPYAVNGLQELIADYRALPLLELKRAYSSMFEVGSDGPPVPIREDLQLGQKAGVREELVRFYDFFGYTLSEKFAWAPDHLSLELEFMQFLAISEAEGLDQLANGETPETDVASFQFGQFDFLQRHLINWVPIVLHAVEEQNSDSFYYRVVTVLRDFLAADFEWQSGTITTPGVK